MNKKTKITTQYEHGRWVRNMEIKYRKTRNGGAVGWGRKNRGKNHL